MMDEIALSKPLSPALRAKVDQLFGLGDAPEAKSLLETDCTGDSPLIASQGDNGLERVRCAVLKLSNGSLGMLKSAIQAAQADWRDTLVAADFANDTRQHLAWLHST